MNTSMKKLASFVAVSLLSCSAIAQEIQTYHLEFDSKSEDVSIKTLKDAIAGTHWSPACTIPTFVTADDLAHRLNENVLVASSLPFKRECRVITLRDTQGAFIPLSEYSLLNNSMDIGSSGLFGDKAQIFINHHDSLNVAYALNSERELEYLDSYPGEKKKVYTAGGLIENSTFKFIPNWPLSSSLLEGNISIKKNGLSEKVVHKGMTLQSSEILAGEFVLVDAGRDHYSLIGYDRTVQISENEMYNTSIFKDHVIYTDEEHPEGSVTIKAFNSTNQKTSVLGNFFLTPIGLDHIDFRSRGSIEKIPGTGIITNDKLNTIQLVLNANNVDDIDRLELDIIGDVGEAGSLVVAEWEDSSALSSSSFASVNYIDIETMAVNSLSFVGTELERFEQEILSHFVYNDDVTNLLDGNAFQFSEQVCVDDCYEDYQVDFSLTLVDGEFVLSDVKVEKDYL